MSEALAALLRGALLERGATVSMALGSGGGPELVFEGRPVDAEHVARWAMANAEARRDLARWAERLAHQAGVAGGETSVERALR
jgi:hypothetical protein